MNSRIYQWTSVARPLDPSFPTNRAVLWLMPLCGIVSVVARWWSSGWDPTLLLIFAAGAGSALGGWALVRECAPDAPMVAFAGLALAVAVVILVPESSLLLLFSILLLMRIVNRTVGLPARAIDGVAVSLMVASTIYATGITTLAFAAGAAYLFDAVPAPRHRRHAIIGVGWIAAGVVLLLTAGFAPLHTPSFGPMEWTLSAIALLFLLRTVRVGPPRSAGDATGIRLSRFRIRSGLIVCLIGAAPTLFLPDSLAVQALPVWAALAAVGLLGTGVGAPSSAK